jgi:hypothetical protein
MEQLQSYADERLVASCIYCGHITETRDHVPSRILLDEPYPENLPVVPSCATCNAGFSLDEEYFACLVDCVLAGSVEDVKRLKIRRTLQQKPFLAAKLSQARTVMLNGTVHFDIEHERVQNIILKLARGHTAFELSEPKREKPCHVSCVPLTSLDENACSQFETPPQVTMWPEIGSRAMQRLLVTQNDVRNGWIDVQSGRYRYLTAVRDSILVRFVISEYLACQVLWQS